MLYIAIHATSADTPLPHQGHGSSIVMARGSEGGSAIRFHSYEAKKRGIYGLFGTLYCPSCDEMFDRILVEFKKPSHDFLSVWLGKCEPLDEFKQKGAVRCPRCGGLNLVLGAMKDREIACPRCIEGKLVGSVEKIT